MNQLKFLTSLSLIAVFSIFSFSIAISYAQVPGSASGDNVSSSSNGDSGNVGGTSTPPPSGDSGNIGGTSTPPPSGNSGNTGGTSTPPPSGSGSDTGGTSTPPASGSGQDTGGTSNPPSGGDGGPSNPPPSGNSGNTGGTSNPPPSSNNSNVGGTGGSPSNPPTSLLPGGGGANGIPISLPSFSGVASGEPAVPVSNPVSSVPTPSSCNYITRYMTLGANNDSAEVLKLQAFLKNTENLDVDINGVYDLKTFNAVKVFQSKYADDVLKKSWGVSDPTGIVFFTTRLKINDIYCQTYTNFSNLRLPKIVFVKNPNTSETTPTSNPPANIELPLPGEEPSTTPSTLIGQSTDEDIEMVESTAVAAVGKSGIERLFYSVKGFFGRVFGKKTSTTTATSTATK